MNSVERPVRCAILTVSDSRQESNDKSGDCLQARLEQGGHVLAVRALCPDDRYQIRAYCSRWIADPEVEVILLTGGTGLTGRDGTPEAIHPLFDKEVEGFGELFRQISYEDIGASTIQSRCCAGIANGTLLFALPGSTGACATAWDRILSRQLDARTKPCNFVQLMPRFRER